MSLTDLRLIWFFIKPYRWRYGMILSVSLLASALEGVNLIAFFPVFQALAGSMGQGASGTTGMAQALLMRFPFSRSLLAATVILGSVMVLKVMVTLLREWLIAAASGTVLYTLSDRLLKQYAAAPHEVLVETKQGAVLYNCLNAPGRVSFVLLRVPQALAEALKILAIVGVLWLIWPGATLVLAAVGVGYYWLTRWLARRVSYTTGAGRAAAFTEQISIAGELLRGLRQITVASAVSEWLVRFDRANRHHRALYVKDLAWLAAPVSVMELAALTLFVGAMLMIGGQGQPHVAAVLPVLGVFAMASLRLLHALTNAGRQTMEMMSRLPDLFLAHTVLTQPSQPLLDGPRVFTALASRIQCEDVSFAYRGREPTLQNVSVAFEGGTVTALVGPSGSGKTTLINLLLRVLEPTGGTITVDGVPLAEYQRRTWLSKLGFVSQDPFLFHGTVADNILIGRTGFRHEEIVKAAQIANAHEFIMKLPQGYETMIGERGMKLSGGQQQRIAIARAVLGDPQLLIFDEATSHLDSVSEQQVQEAIERVAAGRTVILVAHRLSTIRRADRILVLQEGQVVEEGTHEELLKGQKHYFQLMQASVT